MPKAGIAKVPYWKMVCGKLGMSEDDIRMLLDMSEAERTDRLIRRFRDSRDSNEGTRILTVLGAIGDIELTADLYIEILQSNNPHDLKFRAAFEGGMERFDGHLRLRKAIEEHLRGASTPAEAWIRDEFPDGETCPLRRPKPSPDDER